MYVCTDCGQRYDRDGFCGKDGKPLVHSDDPLIGTEIGRYRIVRVIGQGGMGRVYQAVQPHIGSRVAVKVLSEQCARDPDLLERFFAEARTVNLIRHEHIVSTIDLAQLPDGRPYIVMEYVEGQTLGRATRGGRAPLGGIVQVVTETLSALAAAHEHQIVHRDLKPDNIIVTLQGHAKVLDFGIAKLSPGLQHPMSPRTRTGALLGTPAYMAPEQISGAENVDARTDVYAAGVVLFETITGTLPFSGATAFDLMRAQLEDPAPSVRDRRPEVPEVLAQVIAQALAKAPEDRFESASAMREALLVAAAHLPVDQLRALSEERASLPKLTSPTTPRLPTRGHTPAAFSAVRAPAELPSSDAPTERDVAAKPDEARRARRPPWGWIAGAVALSAVAVSVTVIVMSRDPEPQIAAPAATAAPTPTTPPPATVTAKTTPRVDTTSHAPTIPPATTTSPRTPRTPPVAERPPAATANATPPAATAKVPPTLKPTPTTPKTPPSATAAKETVLTAKTSPAATAAKNTAPPAAPSGYAARVKSPEELAREALANKWNRHPDSIALPGEHPIARRPRVSAAPRYDATNVDYRKILAPALAVGRTELPGAYLVSISLRLRDGHLDLKSGYRPLLIELASETKVEGDCRLTVEFTARQVDVYFLDVIFCNAKPIRTPTCSAQSVWERAGSPGAGTPSEEITLEFSGTSWEVAGQKIPDDC